MRRRVALGGALTRALLLYWLVLFPHARAELRRWGRRAAEIREPVLRELALEKLDREALVAEGAAAFAILTARAHRADVVRAVVAYEVLYDVVDAVGELPSPDSLAHNRVVHAALVDALAPRSPLHFRFGEPAAEEPCFLTMLVGACRDALARLPAHRLALPALERFAMRAVEAQSRNHAGIQTGDHRLLAHWAAAQGVHDAFWWEVAAAAGDPLGVFALVAAAGDPATRDRDVAAIERAYFPTIGTFVWLMESLVDQQEDACSGNHSYVGRYDSPQEAARRLMALALQAGRSAEALPRGHAHAVLLTGVASLYLSDPRLHAAGATGAAAAIRDALGWPVVPLLWALRLRRRLARSGASRCRS